MLQKNTNSLKHLAFSCALLYGLSPLSAAWANQAHNVHGQAPVSVAQSRAELSSILPAGIQLQYMSTLTSLYATEHMKPMWQDHQAVKHFQQQLAELAMSGIQPRFGQWAKDLANPALTGLARDAVLSDAMLGYLQYVSSVQANGSNWLYNGIAYKLAAPSSSVIGQWQKAVRQHETLAYINSLAPQHPQYEKMHQALVTLVADNKSWPQLAMNSSLRPGESNPGVPALREILQRTGMMSADAPTRSPEPTAVETAQSVPAADDDTSVDEEQQSSPAIVSPAVGLLSGDHDAPAATVDHNLVYSPDLVAAVKRFQEWQGLDADGVIGKRTREWLNTSPHTRANLLALNIQRLRILPGNVNTGIMVNIPNYSLIYYRNGQEVLASRVIVGRPSRKTPLMNSALNNVVVNPPWNVPTTLVREDIVPKAMHDASYFARNNFVLLSSWGNDATEVNPAYIDWGTVSARNFPYRVRQSPGPKNSLGRYKFNMPSQDAIYLHDTPNKGLFERDIRALSSGCVRVNKAADLASMLLQDSGWNDTRMSSTLTAGNTTFVNIKQRVPVQLYYLTAWVSSEGQVQYRTDIYNYDNTARSSSQISAKANKLLL